MSSKYLNWIIGGIGIGSIVIIGGAIYFILKKKDSTDHEEDTLIVDKSTKLKDKDISKDPTEKSKEIPDAGEFVPLDIDKLSELFKKVANFVVEQIYFNYEIYIKEFDSNGLYTGINPLYNGISGKQYKEEVIFRIQSENYKIIASSTDPAQYNKSLQYYLGSNN